MRRTYFFITIVRLLHILDRQSSVNIPGPVTSFFRPFDARFHLKDSSHVRYQNNAEKVTVIFPELL